LIFDLSRPVLPNEIKPLGLYVAGLIGISDCIDRACLDPARLFYVPRCPEERLPLFKCSVVNGELLQVDSFLVEAQKIEAASKITPKRIGQSRSVIKAFNDLHEVGLILEQHGYKKKGRNRWLYPGSTTGLAGVRILSGSSPERIYSSHSGDPLANGKAHDAFDCWRILKHAGDMNAAVREAAKLVGLERLTDLQADNNAIAGKYVREVNLLRACDVTLEPITWLWHGWLAAGKMHIFGGAPGTGKTTISMALAATVTTGGCWPDGTRAIAGNVVIWSGEDDPSDTLAPRLILSGADMNRVYFISSIQDGTEKRSFDPARDMEPLRRKLEEIGDVQLLIVDPIVSAIAGDSHKNAEVRRGFQPLVDLAASIGCALLGITHFSKGTGGRDPVERINGSLAFGALARVVLVAAKHREEGEDGKAKRIFCRAKSNIGLDSGGFEYDLQPSELKTHPGIFASFVQWGDFLEGTARELLATADTTGDDGEGGALDDAKQYLAGLLADGPLSSNDIRKRAESDGYSWATIRRAKDELIIKAQKDGMKSGWVWRMPEHETVKAFPENTKMLKNAEDAQQKGVSTFGKFEHLHAKDICELPAWLRRPE